MIDLALNILTIGIKPLYEKNASYHKLIKEFREKLPRSQNQAKRIEEESLSSNSPLKGLSNFMTVIDLSTQKTSISEADIDLFYNKLNSFDYRFVFFKQHYQAYTNNLNRFNPQATNRDFDLAVIQIVLKDNELNPLAPLDILFFHLKWKWKYSSAIYLFFKKHK